MSNSISTDKWSDRPLTNGQTPNLIHFSIQMYHLVAIILMIFQIINWPNSVYLLVDPAFLSPPLKFLWTIALFSPVGWMPQKDTNDKQTIGQTDWNLRGGVKIRDQPINARNLVSWLSWKSFKIAATRYHILRLKCTRFDCRWGSAPDPAGETYSWRRGMEGKGKVCFIGFVGLTPLVLVR